MTGDVLSAEDREALARAARVLGWQHLVRYSGQTEEWMNRTLAAMVRAVLASCAVAAEAARAEMVARVLALADEWEECAVRATSRGYPSPQDTMTFAQEFHATKLRALVAPDHAEADRGQG